MNLYTLALKPREPVNINQLNLLYNYTGIFKLHAMQLCI
jgi:hypothetical protein